MEVVAVNVGDRVLAMVRGVLDESAIRADIHPDSRLVEIGLNSMDMVMLMLKVEAEFDLVIPQHEITPENFHSVSALERMIVRQIGQASG